TDISDRLKMILKSSSRNSGASDKVLDLNCRWIMIILVDHLMQNGADDKLFIDELINRFI
ncbi:MAG: hypothetical protein PQJ50_05165, partial [Spirochaetales bacterium]|nr:hypothetical protein [Spirochaetales bacterium]